MKRLVLLRHGESEWNRENRFTGWTDVTLSQKGIKEAMEAGRLLKQEGYVFDVAFTSVLARAVKTLWLALEAMDLMWIPVYNHWRLNERHYGALQGLNKAETAARHGEAQVKIWRRNYDIPRPALTLDDPRHPAKDPRYAGLNPGEVRQAESLKDTVRRAFFPVGMKLLRRSCRRESASSSPLTATVCARWSNTWIKFLLKTSLSSTFRTGIPLVLELRDDLTPDPSFLSG
jgi:2,3-bisphosphoglycerate-dependent phosphoglycerate mutase